MKKQLPIIIALAACLLVLSGVALQHTESKSDTKAPAPAATVVAEGNHTHNHASHTPPPTPEASAPAPVGQARQIVHFDPVTGKIIPPPKDIAPLALTPEAKQSLNRSSKGLVEEPVAGPGGGVKVNLQGRFQSMSTVTIGPDGKVTMNCDTKLPPSVTGSATDDHPHQHVSAPKTN